MFAFLQSKLQTLRLPILMVGIMLDYFRLKSPVTLGQGLISAVQDIHLSSDIQHLILDGSMTA